MGLDNPANVLTDIKTFQAEQTGWAYDNFDDYPLGSISSLTGGGGFSSNGIVTGGTIVSRTTHNGKIEKRLSLVAGEYIRTLPWGSIWSSIRIIIMGRMNATANFNGEIRLGLCAGTTDTIGDGDSVDNFIGLGSGNPFGTTSWTHAAGTTVPHQSVNAFGNIWKHGATNSGYTGPTAGLAFPETEAFKLMFAIDVTRPERALASTAVTYSFTNRNGPGIATTAGWFQEKWAMFNQWRDNDQIPIMGSGTNATTIASVTETDGAFDTLNFYWSNATAGNAFDIAAIGVYKLR